MSKQIKPKEITLSEKLRLGKLGAALNPAKVELKAIEVYGKREYRKELANRLGGSTTLYVFAFRGEAPYKLYQIDQHLNSIAN